jgi:hypothetical protein
VQSLRVVSRIGSRRRPQLPRSEVCRIGRAIGERRVRAPAVVERDVTRDRGARLAYRLVDPEIDLLVLERFPEALSLYLLEHEFAGRV